MGGLNDLNDLISQSTDCQRRRSKKQFRKGSGTRLVAGDALRTFSQMYFVPNPTMMTNGDPEIAKSRNIRPSPTIPEPPANVKAGGGERNCATGETTRFSVLETAK